LRLINRRELDARVLEEASGVAAGAARGLGVKGEFGHGSRIVEIGETTPNPNVERHILKLG
jgi:hypothetical protein